MFKYIAIYTFLALGTWWAGENVEDVRIVFDAITGYGDKGWVLYFILPLIATLIIAFKSWGSTGYGDSGGGDFFDGGGDCGE